MSVQFPGLDQYIKGLKEYERDIKKATAKANREVAKFVQPKVQSAYRREYPNSTRSWRGIGRRAGMRKASIVLNVPRYPYLMGREFGSKRFRQFPSFRRSGYFLYPTLADERDEIVEFYAEAHEQELKRAFPR